MTYTAPSAPRTPDALPTPRLLHTLLADRRLAPLWTLLRLYVGWQWLSAGWAKVTDPTWVGAQAGQSITGFLKGALDKAGGESPDVTPWYAWLVEHVALPHATLFSYLIPFGELAIGLALVLGLLTGVAALFGAFLNLNFLLAGTLSTNPVLLVLAALLVAAWRVAGWWGLDRWVLPRLSRGREHVMG